MELQRSLPDFERQGVAVFAVSYDSVDVLRDFGEKRGITYPHLSDAGSHVIRTLGLYNQHRVDQSTALGMEPKDYQEGIPYPGTFVLDRNGVVVDKLFLQHYRQRPSGAALLESVYGADSTRQTARASAESEHLRIHVWVGQDIYRPNQLLRLNLRIEIARGLHVYGRPIPDGYTPLTVTVEPIAGLVIGELELPPPSPFQVSGLDEEFHVYHGEVRGSLPLTLTQNLGATALRLQVGYQACSEVECFPPSQLALDLKLEGEEPVRD